MMQAKKKDTGSALGGGLKKNELTLEQDPFFDLNKKMKENKPRVDFIHHNIQKV